MQQLHWHRSKVQHTTSKSNTNKGSCCAKSTWKSSKKHKSSALSIAKCKELHMLKWWKLWLKSQRFWLKRKINWSNLFKQTNPQQHWAQFTQWKSHVRTQHHTLWLWNCFQLWCVCVCVFRSACFHDLFKTLNMEWVLGDEVVDDKTCHWSCLGSNNCVLVPEQKQIWWSTAGMFGQCKGLSRHKEQGTAGNEC